MHLHPQVGHRSSQPTFFLIRSQSWPLEQEHEAASVLQRLLSNADWHTGQESAHWITSCTIGHTGVSCEDPGAGVAGTTGGSSVPGGPSAYILGPSSTLSSLTPISCADSGGSACCGTPLACGSPLSAAELTGASCSGGSATQVRSSLLCEFSLSCRACDIQPCPP